ncbi:MAG: transcription factor S [Methanobacteriota archaeon]|nr:MAG: transcription factor S [Euryarchaeota archaeon]
MFCPKCGSLMFPSANGEKLVCGNATCRFEKGVTKAEIATSRTAVKVNRDRPAEMLVLDDVLETLPKTRAECPKCGHGEAFWVMRQTRAADEPTTRIYRCVKCSHTWREY